MTYFKYPHQKHTARMLKEKYPMPEPRALMYIKIVPNDKPNASGRWITVARKTERYLGWSATAELYASDIPDGHHAVSFVRDPKQRWGGTIEGE